jgi:ribonuclease Y
MEEAIVHAINAHHDDVEATTPEAIVVRVCDALSPAAPAPAATPSKTMPSA